MKLSLAPVLTAAVFALAACDVHVPDPIATQEDTPPQEAPVTAKRSLVHGTAMPTSPVNLLTDPGFSLVGQEAGYGSFLSFYAKNFGPYTPYIGVDSTSPAGFGGVAYVRPARATDEKSDAVLMLTSFPGGKGPFRAELWASKATIKDAPADMPEDGSALRATVADGSPEAGGFDLKPDFASKRVLGTRTWVPYRGEITAPLLQGAFFVITTGTAGGNVLVAAPSITSAEITAGGELKSASPKAAGLARRALSSTEREAIAKYRAVPPRLMAAGATLPKPKPRAGL